MHPALPHSDSVPGAAGPTGVAPEPDAGSLDAIADDDPLLHALRWLTRHHGQERSVAALTAGLQIDGPLGPDQALRVLREAGFDAGLIQRPVGRIHPLLLPVVLLLHRGDACIVAAREAGADGQPDVYTVILPGPEHHTVRATEADLQLAYAGLAIAATPPVVPSPAPGGEPASRDPGTHWLWGTLRRFLPSYRSAVLASLLSHVFMLTGALLVSAAYDAVNPQSAFGLLWALAAGAVLALVFDTVARHLRSGLIDAAGRKADLQIDAALFRQALGLRMEHRPPSSGSFAHRLAQVETVREFLGSATLAVLSDLPFLLLFVAMIFVVAGPLGWVMVAAVPLVFAMSGAVHGRLRRTLDAKQAHQADLQGVLVEALEGFEDMKAAGAQGRFLRRCEAATAVAASTAMRARTLGAWTHTLAVSMQQAAMLVMVIWGIHRVHGQVITAGAFIAAILLAHRAMSPLATLASLATRYQAARAAIAALDPWMALPVEREPGRVYAAHPGPGARLAMAGVRFAYPGRAGERSPVVLDGVSLSLEPGERVAILGRIGSGKSTLLRLLAGLYQPVEGRVEVDGTDVGRIDPADFRAAVGFVSQEPHLFSGSLRDNVVMGRPGVDAARLARVAVMTGLDRVVAAHPSGWEQEVGERGARLSAGQRQLVALARSLIARPQILLMDEPTSAMDAPSEMLFLRQLEETVGRCTLVMVTHRPAALELMDRVLVMDGGRVVLDGPKAQVLAVLAGRASDPGASSAPAATAPSATATDPHARFADHPVAA